MMTPKPLVCPLCDRVLQTRTDPAAGQVHAIGRHLERECTVRIV